MPKLSRAVNAVQTVDIRIDKTGSVAIIVPESEAGRKWMDENLLCDEWQWTNGGLAVEPRAILVIAESAQEDGLEVRQ